MLGLTADFLNSVWWWPVLYCYLWWQDQIWSPVDIMTAIYNRVIHAVPAAEEPLVRCGWFALKVSTVAKMRIGRLVTGINSYIIQPIQHSLWPVQEVKDVRLIRDGETMITVPFMNIPPELKECEYDMVLYEWRAPVKDKMDYYVLRFDSLKDVTDNFKFSDAKIKTPCVTLEGADEKYQIEFGKEDYAIAGNILFDRIFIDYWLRRKHSKVIEPDQKYTVMFFDDQFNQYTVSQDQYVLMCSSGFTIVSNDEDTRCLEENIVGNEPGAEADDEDDEEDEDPVSDAGLVNLVEAGDNSWMGMGAFYKWTSTPVTQKKND